MQIVLALLGYTCASPFLQDTPEVVAERARFMQLWNAQAAAAAAAPDIHTHAQNIHHAPAHHTPAHYSPTTHQGVWRGPVAATIPAGVQGALSQVADTADVTAARNAFLAAYRAQVAATTGHNVAPRQHQTPVATQHRFQPAAHTFNAIPAGPSKWMGPKAATVGAGVNGVITPVSDTAEVVAARNAFLRTYNAALAASRPSAPATQNFHQFAAVNHHNAQPAQPRWTGPVAATIPAGLPGASYQVSQTADVAAATAAFQQAYNAAVAATTGRRF